MYRTTLLLIGLTGIVACQQTDCCPATCATARFSVETDFDGARGEYCRVTPEGAVTLLIAPEDQGQINNSPWYAFRLDPRARGSAEVTLQYTGGDHRYWPRMSLDGHNWSPLAAGQVKVLKNKAETTLTIPLEDQSVWIAAQELLTKEQTEQPIKDAVVRVDGTWNSFGTSEEGRPIHVGQINPNANEWILLIGRQHPPEITGTLAMHSFVLAITSDSPLAQRFRQRFSIAIIPLVNPDGVTHGHWRHNARGADLNRDWGPFVEPETQQIKALIDQLDQPHRKARLFVDFHSTRRNTLYTQTDDEPTDPPNFAARWLAASHTRLGEDLFSRSARRSSCLLYTSPSPRD